MCVCERERDVERECATEMYLWEREREREKQKERKSVCEREGDRESSVTEVCVRERASVCERGRRASGKAHLRSSPHKRLKLLLLGNDFFYRNGG